MKLFLSFYSKTMSCLLTGIVLLSWSTPSVAQEGFGHSRQVSDPFEAQYFTNRYLGNPAMAGLDSTLDISVAYRKQFAGMPGAPVTEALTADYNPGKRVGLGLIAYNDKAGLINQTRVALTYAYHLPVGDFGQELHFGISAAFAHARLDAKGIVGDETDPMIAEFNGRKNAFEVDYGMAYTDGNITLQASLINLVGFMKHFDKTTANESIFCLAAAYAFHFNGVVNTLEPQMSLRGVKQYNSIVDVGANVVMFHRILNIFGLFHTSGTFSTGVGLNYKDIIFIQGAYLSKTKGLRDYTDGNYEIDLRITLFRNRK